MKSLSSLINKTPWWALLLGGFLLALGLAVFVTPFQLIGLNKSGATVEENRAIKREVDLTFSEGAIDLAGSIVKEMRDHTHDLVRQKELERALAEIDNARQSLREAGVEVLRAKREAAENVTGAVRDASKAIAEAQKEAARAMKEAGMDDNKIRQLLEESLAAAKKAEVEAGRSVAETRSLRSAEKIRRAQEKLDRKLGAAAPRLPAPMIEIDLGDSASTTVPGAAPPPPLPPELRAQIRKKVTGDLWRIGVGTGLILIFIPLFILTVVSKFFIDRSRASQRMADLTRKEAEYHRMSQQVTEAKLSALQAQVEPHFLYNTLASVRR